MTLSPFYSSLLEWTALSIGTVGTIMWSLNKNQLVVSSLWLVSSLMWIVFAQFNGHYGLTVRDALGVFMYATGIWTYTKAQRKAASEGSESVKDSSSAK
jgi:hypothetical protein